jgi:hypothetical protein
VTSCDPESSFSLRAVSSLESAAGIPVMTTLSDHTRRIQNILGLPILDLNVLLNSWIRGKQLLPPSWRNLLLIVRLLHQDELAQRMETYLSTGATEELSPTRGKQGELGNSISRSYSHCMCVSRCCVLGDEEVDEQMRLRDNVIFQLKQQMATQQQMIGNLEHRNKELEEILIKEEGIVPINHSGNPLLASLVYVHT